MKNNKKIKLGKLKFYVVDDNYINYLRKFDKHVDYNKDQTRPYIGVVIILEKYYYFAPLFSPKQKHETYKDNLTFFKINSKTKNNLGIIRFSNMIPVPQESINLLDVKNKSYGYKRLISEQYSYINMTKNKEKIINKAEKIYKIVTKNKNNKMSKFYRELSCNFKLLEEKSDKYIIKKF